MKQKRPTKDAINMVIKALDCHDEAALVDTSEFFDPSVMVVVGRVTISVAETVALPS